MLVSCQFGAGSGVTQQGQYISRLFRLLFVIAIPIAALVYGLIVWSVIRYRKRQGADGLPKQTRSNAPIEVIYTFVPVLIVIAIFVATFRTETKVDRVRPDPAVVLNVTGFQWQWRFSYPQGNVTIIGTPGANPVIELPVNRTVQVNVTSADVVHSFFVPAFLFKRDAIPGVVNHFDWVIPASRAGQTFRGECAAFCGLDHADMTFFVKAVTPQDFAAWLARQSTPGSAA